MPVEVAGPQAAGYGLGMEELSRRAVLVRDNHGLRQRLISTVLARRSPFPESPHVEEQIYGGFYSWADQALIDEFHRSDWPRRLEIASEFADPRLRTLARRLVYCEAPDVMPAALRLTYARAIASRIQSRTERTGRWTTLDEAIEEAEKMLTGISVEREPLLRGHFARLCAWRDEASAALHAALIDPLPPAGVGSSTRAAA
jgi:exodeoxyribonuclease-1